MRRLVMAAVAGGMLVLAGCSSPGDAEEQPDTAGSDVTITDPWLKATEEGVHMTGGFGVLANSGSEDVLVVRASSDVTDRTELHEMVDQGGGTPLMAEVEDGFVIPAGGEFVLEPGGNHLMLMELAEVIEPGEFVEFSLEFEDGEVLTFEAEARTYAGANENYEGDHGMHDHETHDHETHDH